MISAFDITPEHINAYCYYLAVKAEMKYDFFIADKYNKITGDTPFHGYGKPDIEFSVLQAGLFRYGKPHRIFPTVGIFEFIENTDINSSDTFKYWKIRMEDIKRGRTAEQIIKLRNKTGMLLYHA